MHQFAGIRRADKGCVGAAEEALRDGAAVLRWRQAAVLLVDEVSMLSAALLEVRAVAMI